MQSNFRERTCAAFGERQRLLQAVLASSALVAMPVFAESAHAQAVSSESETGEIIVTAQKRAESVRDVPQSLVVIKGETLTSQGLQSVSDLTSQFPGVTTFSFGGAGQSQINIRGITLGFDTASTVATYLDDIPFGSGSSYSGLSQTGLELGSFDVERVELLRGPQGTLYGASALGGLLKYVLVQPDASDFAATLQAEGSTSDRSNSYAVRGSVNVPLVADKMAIRVTALHGHDGGNVDNIARDLSNIDRYSKDVARVSLVFAPTERLTLRANALVQGLDRDGSSEVYYSVATGKPLYGDFTNNQALPTSFRQRAESYSVNGEYDLGFANLQATIGRQHFDNQLVQDVSDAYPVIFSAFFPINGADIYTHLKLHKTTAEVRLASSGKQKLEYIVGIFYDDEDILKYQALGGYLNTAKLPVDLGTFTIPSTYREYAAYGNVTYHFSSKLDATFGIRASRNQQAFRQIGTGLLGSSNPGAKQKATVLTYLGTIRYHLSGDNMLYARASSGYRPGGPNLIAFDPVTHAQIGSSTFKADSLWNYEIGAKLRPASWLTADISAFYIDWKDIQLVAVRNGLGVIANGGTARSKGVEFALTARPLPNWTTSITGAWMDAKLTEAAPDVAGRADERLPNSPHLSMTAATDYRIFKSDTVSATVGASWRYIGLRKSSFDASTTAPQYTQPAFSTVDLRARIETRQFDVGFYLRNLFDKRGQISAVTNFAFAGGPARVSVTQPRTFGLVLTARY